MDDDREDGGEVTYEDFLTRVIDDGIAAARQSYGGTDQKHKLEGAVAGFESCRRKKPRELAQHYYRAEDAKKWAIVGNTNAKRYWRLACYYAEVEWVCNVVSALCYAGGKRELAIIATTARGVAKMQQVFHGNEPSGEPEDFSAWKQRLAEMDASLEKLLQEKP